MEAKGHPGDPECWPRTTVRSYLIHLSERTKSDGTPLAPTSINGMARSLRAFCSWLVSDESVEKHPFGKTKPPKAMKPIKPTLGNDDVHALLKGAKTATRSPLRDEATLPLLLDTGARASELCSLSFSGIDWEQWIDKPFGKGSKERYVPVSIATERAMRRFALRERRGLSDTFFESDEGRQRTTSGLRQICKRVGNRAGVQVPPHKLRHTFAITYLRNGASVFAVQKMLGHASLDVTLQYAAMVTDDLINEHRDHSPVANLPQSTRKRKR
jgi:site-specific recombinase XerD